jgi:DNA mismatch endonuclease (patch repair protein)
MVARARSGRPASSVRTPRDELAASWASTPAVRDRMQRQRTRDTAPELAVRRLLHSAGLRYRIDVAPLPELRRRADIVFVRARVAVFVDGCFWHGCPLHGSRTTTANTEYWREKVLRNRSRDAETDSQLAAAGWVSFRAWEHQDPVAVASEVAEIVCRRRACELRSRPIEPSDAGLSSRDKRADRAGSEPGTPRTRIN